MAKMSHTAVFLLLVAAMLVSCHAQAEDPNLAKKKKQTIDCPTWCGGGDLNHKKKGSNLPFPANNWPKKCGQYKQPSGAVCPCGDCADYANLVPADPRTCIVDGNGGQGVCCSCGTTLGKNCACGGTSPSSATFCKADGQIAGNVCLSCKTAVCCASGTITRRGPSFTYTGVGTGPGQIDWANIAAPASIGAAWPTSITFQCPTGKYSCGGVTCFV